MNTDKQYKALLEIYREVYRSIQVDFDSLDKEEDFYMNYVVEASIQESIIRKVFNKYNFSVIQKRSILTSYFLGCSPRFSK